MGNEAFRAFDFGGEPREAGMDATDRPGGEEPFATVEPQEIPLTTSAEPPTDRPLDLTTRLQQGEQVPVAGLGTLSFDQNGTLHLEFDDVPPAAPAEEQPVRVRTDNLVSGLMRLRTRLVDEPYGAAHDPRRYLEEDE